MHDIRKNKKHSIVMCLPVSFDHQFILQEKYKVLYLFAKKTKQKNTGYVINFNIRRILSLNINQKLTWQC